jgi:hypothetical protein
VINVVVHLLHGLAISNDVQLAVFLTDTDSLHRRTLRHHRRLVRTDEEIEMRSFLVYEVVLDAMVFRFQIAEHSKNFWIIFQILYSFLVDSGRGALPREKI